MKPVKEFEHEFNGLGGLARINQIKIVLIRLIRPIRVQKNNIFYSNLEFPNNFQDFITNKFAKKNRLSKINETHQRKSKRPN